MVFPRSNKLNKQKQKGKKNSERCGEKIKGQRWSKLTFLHSLYNHYIEHAGSTKEK